MSQSEPVASSPPAPPSVLLVDDTPANLFALSAVLQPLGARLVEARSGADAVALVAKEQFAVVLLDVQMPGMDGFEAAAKIRAMDNGRELPIIFLTAIHRDESFVKQGYATGAADYITKPFDADIVRARVKAFVDLFEQRETIRRAQVALRTRERDEAVRRLIAFERIATSALKSDDLGVFLEELLDIFMGAADDADAACILLRDHDKLHVQACVGLNEEVDERLSMKIGDGFAGRIAAERRPMELADASTSHLVQSAWLCSRGTKGLYGAPLLHEGEVVGVAYVGSKKVTTFTEVEKRLLGAIVDRAAWAVSTQMKRTRLHDVLMAAPAMISIVRVPSMTIELANPGFRRLFRGRELVGRHISETGLDDAALAILQRAYESGETIAYDELTVHGDFAANGEHEERVFNFTAQPLRNPAGAVDSVLTFAFDVTAHVEARRVIEAHAAERTQLLAREMEARAAAEVASQAKDAFLATVSHELRTPLNAILGWTVTARAKAPPELERALAIVERNARAQARIIEDVLDISRIVSGKLRLDIQAVDLAEIVQSVIESVRPAADAKDIVLDVASTAADRVPADADRIQQVIWNLLSNAIKFTPKGGRVEVQLSASADDTVLRVKDSGEGIPTGFLPHIFEPFRQADASTTRRHSGLGLGLAIVKQLVCAHGGTIRALSDGVGMGSTFEVTLPFKPASKPAEVVMRAPSEPPAPVEAEELRLDGLKVLVVDDEEDARLLLKDVLSERGASVAEAASAHAGFSELERFRPDVIVSDIAMPGGDGYGLIRAVRKLTAERGGRTPAIALTAHARESDGERAFAAGFQRYASKPVDLDRLVSMVANLGGISFGEPVATTER
jgi:signal transduction histidine kinase/DNA-binding response OmpR family regulator/putative methionine-R-sulfoxide reductase with GAF domain